MKSEWTLMKDLEKNRLKREACLAAGYKFDLWVFNYKSKLLIIVW